MAEDFTTYVEVDPNNRLSETASRVTWVSLPSNEDTYLYKDKGVGYFAGDFSILLTIRVSAQDLGSYGSYLTLANALDDLGGLADALAIQWTTPVGAPRYIRALEIHNSLGYAGGFYQISLNTDYFLKFVRDESVGTYGKLYLYVYSDAARTNLLATSSVALKDNEDLRYILIPQSNNTGDAAIHSGYVEEVEITIAGTPTVTTQAVTNISRTTATGNGNITDLGYSNPTAHGVCWNTTGTPTTSDSKTDEGAASATGAFTSAMTGLVAGTLYYVRAYATNTIGTSYGGEVTFTTLSFTPKIFYF